MTTPIVVPLLFLPLVCGFETAERLVLAVDRQQVYSRVEHAIALLLQDLVQLTPVGLHRFHDQDRPAPGKASGSSLDCLQLHSLDVDLEQIEPRQNERID